MQDIIKEYYTDFATCLVFLNVMCSINYVSSLNHIMKQSVMLPDPERTPRLEFDHMFFFAHGKHSAISCSSLLLHPGNDGLLWSQKKLSVQLTTEAHVKTHTFLSLFSNKMFTFFLHFTFIHIMNCLHLIILYLNYQNGDILTALLKSLNLQLYSINV